MIASINPDDLKAEGQEALPEKPEPEQPNEPEEAGVNTDSTI